MIIMDLKANNLLAFKDFEVYFSYPKKIVDSYIENEHLKDHPNFRYKKVNIIMGANASGKTSINTAKARQILSGTPSKPAAKRKTGSTDDPQLRSDRGVK